MNRALIIGLSVAIVAYWLWASVHEIAASQATPLAIFLDKGLLCGVFVVSPLATIATLAGLAGRPLHLIAVAACAVTAGAWILMAFAVPPLSAHQLLWGGFAIVSLAGMAVMKADADARRVRRRLGSGRRA